MKPIAVAVALLAVSAPLAMAQTSTWTLDPNHSEVDFTARHMSLSNVHGRIGNLKGSITLNDADITKSSVSVTIDTTTIDTGVQMRDNDLKSDHFFDVAKFPTATFTSTSVSGSGGHLTVNGNLTLHGVTHPVTLDVQGPSGPLPGMDHKQHAGYSATTTLSRKDFGIGATYPDSVVSDAIQLTIDLDAAKQ
ncbi:MAG TPA: YceI family protein [Terracidiphilus sp.]|jgi:polyisoprenoid-binding protein YceI|nr:YceI family protein [Terracidiphilus sp.]